MTNENPPTANKILLIHLGLNKDTRKLPPIELKDLLNLFLPCGQLSKVLIYSKSKRVKAFLEFETLEKAIEIKNFFHDHSVNNFGKIHVFYSSKTSLDLGKDYLESWDVN